MTTHIRAATHEDCEAIAALMTELHRDEGYDVVATAEEMARALFGAARSVALSALVAVTPTVQVVGALLYYPGYDTLSAVEGYHLADVVVTAAHRRAGVGKALMRALAQTTLREQKEWVSLTVLRKNVAARGFYQSLGMTEVAVDFFAIGKTALSHL